MQRIAMAAPGGRIDAWNANAFFSRLRGFMGQKLQPGDALLLTPCNQIHCCFMRCPIDVVYLDKTGKVLELTPAMKPYTFGRLVRGARSVLELYPGDADRMSISEGSVIAVQEGIL